MKRAKYISNGTITYKIIGEQGTEGPQGANGKSAYQIAVDNGYVGTKSEWLATLKGDKGDIGAQGPQGIQGPKAEKGDIGARGPKGDKGDSDIFIYVGYPKDVNLLSNVFVNSRTTTNGTSISGDAVSNGVTIKSNNTGSVIAEKISDNTFLLEKGKRYRLYHNNHQDIPSEDTYRFDVRTVGGDIIAYENGLHGGSFEVDENISANLWIRINCNNFSVDGTFCVFLEEEQFSYSLTPNIKKDSNMIKPSALSATETVNGVTKTNNQDGTVTLNGTSTDITVINLVRKSSGFYLENGKQYLLRSYNNQNIKKTEDTYRIDLRNDSDIMSYEKTDGGIIYTPNNNKKFSVHLRIGKGMHFDNLTIKPYLSKVDDTDFYEPRSVKVCAYNVGNFSYGQSGTAQGTSDMGDKFVKVFKEINADIYMFSEWDEYFNKENNVLSNDVFGNLKPYHTVSIDTTDGRYVCQMNYSDYIFSSETVQYYADGESRSFSDNVVIFGNKPVHFICTHLPFSSKALRHEDIVKLFNYIETNNIEYYVIGGDFNLGLDSTYTQTQSDIITVAREDIDLIESYGCTSIQGGFWGLRGYDNFFSSCKGNDLIKIKPCDNIVVSKNIFVKNVGIVESDASDHYPIYAEIVIS